MSASTQVYFIGCGLLLALVVSGASVQAEPAANYSIQSVAAPMPDGMLRDHDRAAESSLVPNGSFEMNGGAGTSVFSNWAVVNLAGSNGSWLVQTGATSPHPETMFPVSPPTLGSFAAMTDQTGPGSHALYQDVVVPAAGTTIAFDLFIRNLATDFSEAIDSLDFNVDPNQQFRADLLDPAAGDFDVGAGVVANLYQTQPGDPLISGYVRITRDVAGTGAARTLRLRFAVVDNQSNLNVGIDNVTIGAGGADATELAALDLRGLALLGMMLAFASLWSIRCSRTGTRSGTSTI